MKLTKGERDKVTEQLGDLQYMLVGLICVAMVSFRGHSSATFN